MGQGVPHTVWEKGVVRVFAVVRFGKAARFFAAALALVLLLTGAGAAFGAFAAESGVTLPVVMYHSVVESGDLGQYVISTAELESDFRWLSEHGYTAVLSEDLIAYADRGVPLPEKPVLLTFDDGYVNNYLYAYPLAQKYGMKFVLSMIGKWADYYTEHPDENPAYAEATWAHLREMQESGTVEIGNHSFDMHSTNGARFGTKRKAGESAESYALALTEDLTRFQEEALVQLGRAPVLFAYPFGAVSEGEPEIVRRLGFRVTLSCEEKLSEIRRDPSSLYDLGRFLRVSGVSSEVFFARILKGE